MHNLFLVYFVNLYMFRAYLGPSSGGIVRLKRDGTRAETRCRLSPKRTCPFKSAGASVQSTAGSRDVLISASSAGYTTFRGSVRVLVTHSIPQFPLHFPTPASPCAIRFQTHYTTVCILQLVLNILFRWLPVVLFGLEQSNQDNNHLKRIISTNCCIHMVVPPDDGSRYAPKQANVGEIY